MSFDKFTLPLRPNEVEWKIQSSKSGKTLVVPYIDARAVFNRLDECFGAIFWKNEFKEVSGGFIAGISIDFTQSGEWITKYDGASLTNIEPVKGGISDSMKRAAHAWGLGRELYMKYPKVYVTGEHKYIPNACIPTLDAIVRAIAAGHDLSGKWITIEADGKSNFQIAKPACTPAAFAKVFERVVNGEVDIIEKCKANFDLTEEQAAMLQYLSDNYKSKAA